MMSRTKAISFRQLCAIAKREAAETPDPIESTEWKERIKARVAMDGYQRPLSLDVNRAMDATEQAHPWTRFKIRYQESEPSMPSTEPPPRPAPASIAEFAPSLRDLVAPVLRSFGQSQALKSAAIGSTGSSSSESISLAMQAARDEYWKAYASAASLPLCGHCRTPIRERSDGVRCSECHDLIHVACR